MPTNDMPPRNIVDDTPTRFDEDALRRPSLTLTTARRPTASMHHPLPYPAYEDYGARSGSEKHAQWTEGEKMDEDPIFVGSGHGLGGREGMHSHANPSGSSSSGSGGSSGGSSGGKKTLGHIYRVVMNDDGVPALVPLTDSSSSPSSFHPQCDVACQTSGGSMIWEDEQPPLYQGGGGGSGAMFNGTWRSRVSHPATFSSSFGLNFGTTFGSSSGGNAYYGNNRISRRSRDLRSYTTMFAKYKNKEEFTSLMYKGGSSSMSKGVSTSGLSPLVSSPYYKRRLDRRNYIFSVLQKAQE